SNRKLSNQYIEAARVYHEVTKHSYTSVRSSPYRLDWDNRPAPYKIYPAAGTFALPRELELSALPALEAIAGQPAAPDAALGVEALTRMLFCMGGLTRSKRVGDEDYHFRAAASAGALYPTEIYLAAGEVEGLEPALYHFLPADLKLRGLRRGDWRPMLARAAADRPELAHARAILILTSIFWRSAWKYRARAYRYCFWDAGTMLANLFAAAAAQRIDAGIVTAFKDSELELLLGLDPDREGAVAMVGIGAGGTPAATSPVVEAFPFESIALSPSEVAYDSMIKFHRESRLVARDEVAAIADARAANSAPPGELIRIGETAPEDSMGLGETILRRGSTRQFAQAPILGEVLQSILAASSAPMRADFPPLIDTYLIVNAVEGLAPGAYFFARDAAGFELIKPGEFRDEAGYLCLEQPLGMDASALIVYMADLERTLAALGNRGYRDAHLEAGVRGGRAYLAAYALDRGASGLTFYDDDTAKFFAPHAAGKSPILMVAVGVPRSQSEQKA
ncbi:MAG TPA: SagB/ThcOx family dehydrogenase, partial [Candidatus Binataceae bacterium]|nr:SagB/ThcOx family dehydrogenase [Candidatus Binataceae bacterium]